MIALQWQGQVLSLLDQTKYPQEESWVTCDTVKAVAETLSSGIILDEKVAAMAELPQYAKAEEELYQCSDLLISLGGDGTLLGIGRRTAKFEKPENIVNISLDKMALEKEHTLLLANKLTPERYTINANFNKKYAPQTVADPFEILNFVVLSGGLKEKFPTLEFTTIKCANYKLYRIEEDTCKLLKEFVNTSGKQEYTDKNIDFDTTYIYYIECLTDEGKTIKSNTVKIKTNTENVVKKIFSLW